MSDAEEESFCFYGKPLDPYDEELYPKRKPITVEEQIATDSHGRRRFHGAFTGGFSAGFFNTVGSLEGWTPSEFKSSRSEKQKHVSQNPEDFMDDEDMGEFGFAPQTVRATKDYDTSKKRKLKVFSDGPIPGDPVLHTLLTSGNETIGYLLLKNIGLQEKIKARNEELSSDNKVYGCEMPNVQEPSLPIENDEYNLPNFYKELLSKPKNDNFGLGYSGLANNSISLSKKSSLVIQEKNKKLSIRGQAFGVGAFENDDDDIYAKDDISNYDFELTKEKEKNKKINNTKVLVFDIFVKSNSNSFMKEIHPPPVIPKSFTGKYKIKKSRFEPLPSSDDNKNQERKNIDATSRAELLGEQINSTPSQSKSVTIKENVHKVKSEKSQNDTSNKEINTSATVTSNKNIPKINKFDPASLWNDKFVSAVQADDATNILAPVQKYSIEHYSQEMRDAAKLKMFGALTRISEAWYPCSLLCKRFNVPEPFLERSNVKTKKKINLIFEYQKHHEENVLLPGLTTRSEEIPQETVPNEVVSEETEVNDIKQEIDLTKEDLNPETSTELNIENIKSEPVDEEKIQNNVVDITDRLNVQEKGDLFKAIFQDSSSESEEETEEIVEETNKKEVEDTREKELRSNVLGETERLLPKFKPIKKGILYGFDFSQLNTTNDAEEKPVDEKEKTVHEEIEVDVESTSQSVDTNVYGPKLPNKKTEDIKVNFIPKNLRYVEDTNDEWIEKNDKEEKKKKKKHKKEKYSEKSHKKHKHKKSKK